MRETRYLCSHLIRLKQRDGESTVNLETIWTGGATVEAETALAVGEAIELRCGGVNFTGSVTEVERHEFGWRAEIRFSPETPWTIEAFRPDHPHRPRRARGRSNLRQQAELSKPPA